MSTGPGSTGPGSTGPRAAGVLDGTTAAPATAGGDTVTLLHGTTFCLSATCGDISPAGAQGLFAGDARVISRLELRVDGERLLPMLTLSREPSSGRFILRRAPSPGAADSTLLAVRDRLIRDDLRETLTLTNLGAGPAAVTVTLAVDADFADVFAVKDGRAAASRAGTAAAGGGAAVTVSASGSELTLRPRHVDPGAPPAAAGADQAAGTTALGATGLGATGLGATGLGVRVRATGGPLIEPGSLTWRTVIPPHGSWSAEIVARPAADLAAAQEAVPAAGRATAKGGDRVARPGAAADAEDTDTGAAERSVIISAAPAFNQVLQRTAADLSALRISWGSLAPGSGKSTDTAASPQDGAHHLPPPDLPFAAAGAPWFMTLFGRDSLLTAWMALPLDPGLAVGTLRILAALQGRRTDPATEEQPGRILHELRRGPDRVSALGGARYYGTVDATPLFVMLLGESWRWGASEDVVRGLLPAADAALEWITHYGDSDGDGFVEYQRAADPNQPSLANQGWKDSPGSINHSGGRPAAAPIALCEVQGYVYAAWLARAELAVAFGDEATAARCRARAAALRASFGERFWLPGRGWYAVALDGAKQHVTALTSNTAHCLWTGIATDEHAAVLIDRLAGEDMDTGFGLRTLAAGMGAYNPMSYHNGSVWPHDTAIAVAGLLRYAHLPGAAGLARRLATGMLDAICAFGGRPPELYCGFHRRQFGSPVPYPTSCSPQAWASAAPLLVLRAFLGLDPDVPRRRIGLRPALPAQFGAVTLTGLRLGPSRVTITARGDDGGIEDLPSG
ncbi:MAG TPA: glycogen debranching N-terminal domain-containing protein [Streptosporangiaceae bacterium]|nr:glycogen debranching N-terminal domain-containing protein [Streptosporangiaceae bacterium]